MQSISVPFCPCFTSWLALSDGSRQFELATHWRGLCFLFSFLGFHLVSFFISMANDLTSHLPCPVFNNRVLLYALYDCTYIIIPGTAEETRQTRWKKYGPKDVRPRLKPECIIYLFFSIYCPYFLFNYLTWTHVCSKCVMMAMIFRFLTYEQSPQPFYP